MIKMMADTTESVNVHRTYEKNVGDESQYSVKQLKSDLESWKLVLLPLNNLLEWEHKFDPLIIVSVVTFLFGALLAWNPSVLTTVSLVGLFVVCADFLVPLVAQSLFKSSEWNDGSEAKYTRICERLSNCYNHLVNLKNKLVQLRKEKQSLYFLVVLFTLVFFIYVGQLVDNLLLTYLITMFLCLLPGARRHNLFDKSFQYVKSLIKKPSQSSVDVKKSS